MEAPYKFGYIPLLTGIGLSGNGVRVPVGRPTASTPSELDPLDPPPLSLSRKGYLS